MSAKLLGMVLDADLPRPEKFVLAILADHGKEDGTDVYPSVAKIEFKTGYSERQVRDIMASLQRMGLLILVQEGGRGAGDTNEYRIAVEKIPVMDFREWLRKKKGAVFSEARVQSSPKKGATLSVQGCEKLQNEGAKTAPELKTNNLKQELKPEAQIEKPALQNLVSLSGKSGKLSVNERDTIDFKALRREMDKAESVWANSGGRTLGPQEWAGFVRRCAYLAGLTPARAQELMRKFFPDDPAVDLICTNPELPFTGTSP